MLRILFTLAACVGCVLPAKTAKAEEGPASRSILLHAIVEAPVDEVWPLVRNPEVTTKWLWQEASVWKARTGGRFSVVTYGGHEITGRVFKAQPSEGITLTWPTPATLLTLKITALDDHLTMVTLNHEGFTPKVPAALKEMNELRQRWAVAMMKLHRQFPPPVVDTRRHRPRDAEGLFIERSLIVNGDFQYTAERGRYEGVAFGWETNTARSAPKTHRIDDQTGHIRPPAQAIIHPPDWNNFAVQQFTSHLLPMIEPGKRYRLSGWVRAEGIRNPAGWYKLGLWFTDMAGKPIGEPLKNEKVPGDDNKPRLNYDWHHFKIEGVAPPGAARAVVIMSGHWDEAGSVWYDDLQLWEAETPTTRRKPASQPQRNSVP